MNTALVKSNGDPALAIPGGQDAGLGFIDHLQDRWRLAQYMVASGMVPQKRPEEVLVVTLKGYELGIPPMMACANIHVIKGNPTLSAHLMLGLAARRANVRWQVVEHDDTRCAIKFSRTGWEDHVETYTIEQAEKAKLTGKDNWKNDPKAMLFARCGSRGVRAIAPDILAGQYAYEEADSLPDRTVPVAADELNALLDGKPATVEAEATVEELGDPDLHDKLDVRYAELLDAVHPDWTEDYRRSWEKLFVADPESMSAADLRKLIVRLEGQAAKAHA